MRIQDSSRPLLTFVVCSRNDDHDGNAMWRLETTLNYLAGQSAESVGLDAVEVIVSDFGSHQPLREVLTLTDAAAGITSFLEIPPQLAREARRDSPFAEVIANNAAIRRARGEFIGRIDQDTLVGKEFLLGFHSLLQERRTGEFPLASSFMFIGRRSIPFAFSRHSFSMEKVRRFVDVFGNVLPIEGRRQRPWFDAPVGIVVLHRDLWDECRAYDERMLYWGFMEADLAFRISERYSVVDLRRRLGCHLYHAAHTRHPFCRTNRTKNARVLPRQFAPNGPHWGLLNHPLELKPATAGTPAVGIPESWSHRNIRLRFWFPVACEWIWQQLLAWFRVFRNAFRGARITSADSA